jgi:ABC-type sugar transport system ATPase subunit
VKSSGRREHDVDDSVMLELRNITKKFPGVLALDRVGMLIRRAEVHALVGENGAGKSTLIRILSGAQGGWSGQILLKGKPVSLTSPQDAQHLGIASIYQELTLCPNLSVRENIFLGREPVGVGGNILWSAMNASVKDVLGRLAVSIDPETEVAHLSVANRQLVEIARALTIKAQLVVMDEPTSSLSGSDVDRLFRIIRELKAAGIAVLYVSHKMEEIFQIADRITVLRDGQTVGTFTREEASQEQIVSLMVGRPVTMLYEKRRSSVKPVIFRARGLSRPGRFSDISFDLRAGEILGIAGLVGAGRTEVARAIFGLDSFATGQIWMDGRWRSLPRSPVESMKLGIGLIPEDRKEQGLVLSMTVKENISLRWLVARTRSFFVRDDLERNLARDYIERLEIRTSGQEQAVRSLSGGNQQKIVVAKWLAVHSKILFFDEPTRGIDVGAKKEIHDLMLELVSQGIGIVMISSELPEILGMSNRIIAMHDGEITGVFLAEEASAEGIMACATGLTKKELPLERAEGE